MEQGIRLTTGAEFADRDAPPTPVQFDRLLPEAQGLFPLGEKVEPKPWMGSRPCFADSMPAIGRAPEQSGLWLCYGHAHWGLTLGPHYRPPNCGDDHRRHAVLRPHALFGGPFRERTLGLRIACSLM